MLAIAFTSTWRFISRGCKWYPWLKDHMLRGIQKAILVKYNNRIDRSGWAEGVCPLCGQVWHRERPADSLLCDCYKYCPMCGREMQPYTPDLNPRTYRSENTDDPTEEASKHEATAETRLYCPDCDYYSDGVPVEVKLR